MRVSVPIDYTLNVRRNQFLWRRRLSVLDCLDGLGGGNDIITLIVSLPGLALAAVAMVELLLAILLLPVAFVARAATWIPTDIIAEESLRTGEHAATERKLVLRLPTTASARRFLDALAPHVRRGGRLGDPLVGQWFAHERGKVATGPNPWTA